MTEEQFVSATKWLAENGIALDGRAGKIEKDGILAQYGFDGAQLTIEILERPFFLPLSMIEGRMQAYLEQALTPGNKTTV